MKPLFRDVDGAPMCPQGSVVCIGAFDGLHLGHRALIDRAISRARECGLPAVALSFEPLPREYFAKDARPPRLMLPGEHAESEFPWHWLGWGGASLALALLVAWLIVSRVTQPLRSTRSRCMKPASAIGPPNPVAPRRRK